MKNLKSKIILIILAVSLIGLLYGFWAKELKMTNKEKILASEMLKLASDEFGNHGCNDVEDSLFEGWTIGERKQFVKEYHEWNGDPEEYDEDFLHLPDFAIMDFMAHKLAQNSV